HWSSTSTHDPNGIGRRRGSGGKSWQATDVEHARLSRRDVDRGIFPDASIRAAQRLRHTRINVGISRPSNAPSAIMVVGTANSRRCVSSRRLYFYFWRKRLAYVTSSGAFRVWETQFNPKLMELRKQHIKLLFYEDGPDATVSTEQVDGIIGPPE